MHIIEDGGDGWATVVTGDVTKIDNDSAGLTLANYGKFGSAVSFGEKGMLVVGAPGSAGGSVYFVGDGGDSWGSVVAGDVAIVGRDDVETMVGRTGYGEFGVAVAFDTAAHSVSDSYARGLVVGAGQVSSGTRSGVYLFEPAFAAAVASDKFEQTRSRRAAILNWRSGVFR